MPYSATTPTHQDYSPLHYETISTGDNSASAQHCAVILELSNQLNKNQRTCERKRVSAISQSGRSSSPRQPPKKRRRVTFCMTTKPPSNKEQHSLSKTNMLLIPKIITKNLSSDSVPSPSTSFLVSEPSTDELDLSVSPSTFIKKIVLQSKISAGSKQIHGGDIISDASQKVKDASYYLTYKEEHLEAYTNDKVTAVQGNDVETLRALHKSGHIMQASNRFGESMLHTSCRRSFTDTTEFFLNEAGVSPRVRDDMGRTPMHDICWSSASPNHDIMKILIRQAPEMLLSVDKRGHSPFDYARREYWPDWVSFLNDHRHLIVNSLVSSFLGLDHSCTN